MGLPDRSAVSVLAVLEIHQGRLCSDYWVGAIVTPLEQLVERPGVHLISAYNVERVRSYMETHLGCSAKEVAHALELSGDQARRAVRKIRSEWAGQ
jgi:hypothetical protein